MLPTYAYMHTSATECLATGGANRKEEHHLLSHSPHYNDPDTRSPRTVLAVCQAVSSTHRSARF